ncbi:hypothetical protein AYO44_01635 [Planctomycetaceae bacterium SCGC AG-212-F19]|nr:hypothetical protein AYO44_01635 [Planctomycetaceae bacterium SCGC AG-212-F19]
MDNLGFGWDIGGLFLALAYTGTLLCIPIIIVLMGVFGRIADACAPPTNPYDPPLEASDPFYVGHGIESESSSGRACHGIKPPGIS